MSPKLILPVLVVVPYLVLGLAGPAAGQCILANPSFEITAGGGAFLSGWNQFGDVGSVAEAIHGSVAARVSGPDDGGWDVSAVWQSRDGEAGERWEVTGHVRHPASAPLTGASIAMVNIEWHDAGGLIDYESFTVADAGSPTDEFLDFSLLSSAAPAGTVEIHLLLGVLQSPDEPSPDVYFDQVTLFSTTPPTLDDMQWDDFPSGRTLDFAGRTWQVKGTGYYGPGPSYFAHYEDNVWADGDGLHMTIKDLGGLWFSTEVVLEEALGYGDYVFTTRGALDLLDPHAVFGLFIWQYGPCWDDSYLWWNPYNEIDVEISRWNDVNREIAQFVAQPFDWGGNITRFDATFGADELSSHAFNWLPDRVEYRSWRGGPEDESPENMIHEWIYTGPHIPRPEQPRVHINLWQYNGAPATDQEVVVDDFTFVPYDEPTDAPDLPASFAPVARLFPASPNPFNPSTTIRYELRRDGPVEIAVYDVAGARVRTLVNGFATSGEHRVTWNGRDDAGDRLASGVYLCSLRVADVRETRRMMLIK